MHKHFSLCVSQLLQVADDSEASTPPSGCLKDIYLKIYIYISIYIFTHSQRARYFRAISATVMDPQAFTVAAARFCLFSFMTHHYFGGPTKLGQTYVGSVLIFGDQGREFGPSKHYSTKKGS